MKKFFTKEVKIGLGFAIALALLFWGINFLKGVNLFTPTNHYYLKYERLDGLVVSNGVFIKGYKIGQVRTIEYDFTQPVPFTVDIMINKDIKLPKGSVAYLFDESMLGGKGINLILNENSNIHNSGDTLTTAIDGGIITSLTDMIPTVNQTIQHIDSLVVSATGLINSPALNTSINNIQSATSKLNATMTKINGMMNREFPRIINSIDTITYDLRVISGSIKEVDVIDIIQSVDSTILNIKQFTERLNDPNGTIGLLTTDNGLYKELTSTMTSANNLLIDLKANPKRYVHFSLFGSKEKKPKQPKQ